jgi:hypothetical protein
LLWLLLAAALFARAFLPQGYMPERTGAGTIAVVLCSSGGVHHIPLGNGAGQDEEPRRAQPPCAFAGLAAPALPPPALSQVPSPAAAAFAYLALAPAFAPAATPRHHPPARGPPLAA